MSYNIHPLLVHFPIALLSLYAVMEIARFRFFTRQQFWFYTKAVLVILGAISTYPTLLAGNIAEHLVTDRSLHPLIEMHSTFASGAALVASVIAAAYILAWINRDFAAKSRNLFFQSRMWLWPIIVQQYLIDTPIAVVVAIALLAIIVITAALGGSIVYGSNNDPFASAIYHLFFR